jgi:hypothetical protein
VPGRFSLELAEALQDRLNAVTPWHVRIRVFIPDGLDYGYKIGSWRWLNFNRGEGKGGDWRNQTLDVLSGVQSFLVTKTGRAWPATYELPRPPGRPPDSDEEARQRAAAYFERLPHPDVSAEGGEIRLWYGDASRPVLELPSIHNSGALS